jgi:hypothetical protein
MREKVYSSFTCYCGFQNTITFKMPNARYDIRIYPSESNGSVNVHKRLINSSSEVDKAIEGKNEKGTEIQKDSQSH